MADPALHLRISTGLPGDPPKVAGAAPWPNAEPNIGAVEELNHAVANMNAQAAASPGWDPRGRERRITEAYGRATDELYGRVGGLRSLAGPAMAGPFEAAFAGVDECAVDYRRLVDELIRTVDAQMRDSFEKSRLLEQARGLAASLEAELAGRPSHGAVAAAVARADVLDEYIDAGVKGGVVNPQAAGRVRARANKRAAAAYDAAEAVQLEGPGRSLDAAPVV